MSLVQATPVVPLAHMKRVHFIGIGGAGMSGIARVLLQRGVGVSGSDAVDSAVLTELSELGAQVHVGHAETNVSTAGADTVVVSSAVRDDNPELCWSRAAGIRVLPRASVLGSLLLDRRGVAVAGTHGKTTTTSMLTSALQHLGADPGYVIGGSLVSNGIGADAGAGDLMLVEADESDGSFLMLDPAIAVVTNVEADHMDNYATLDEIHASFASFADRVGHGLIACADDPGARKVAEHARMRGVDVRTFGTAAEADYRLADISAEGFATTCTITFPHDQPAPEQQSLRCRVELPGRHNIRNAAATIAVLHMLGYAPQDARDAVATFRGTARRFEPKGTVAGVRVYDSYAHHPTEVAADLRAARSALQSVSDATGSAPGRIVAAFQPHLFSRTRIFASEFAAALSQADEIAVLPIYPARESPQPGVTAHLISDEIDSGRVHTLDSADWETVATRLVEQTRPRSGDIVVTMGAGDVTHLGPQIVSVLERRGMERGNGD
ncbi:UDP-N-acetylmuramate--L-alanine ligase [Lipingzhangella sp. LS1_29]|uniref:UDP-N-acetylmuramate--L-alanine ligase n=1 Tax=Lipingzhangella rawalii TaxID=2055835 RepID=A0ABU2H263_9ACTN|nr:UDP-N-acetylmuramate--L-alanine ligase [Lipingzhangella rawalii]MDS1269397.1 UDP-N-acetylmuramate--L-alanine ligase [Lipingzhangella rawalii]